MRELAAMTGMSHGHLTMIEKVVCGYSRFCKAFLNECNKIECGRVSGLISAAFHAPRAGMVRSLIRSNSIPRALCARPLSGFPDQFNFNRRPYFPQHSLLTDTYF